MGRAQRADGGQGEGMPMVQCGSGSLGRARRHGGRAGPRGLAARASARVRVMARVLWPSGAARSGSVARPAARATARVVPGACTAAAPTAMGRSDGPHACLVAAAVVGSSGPRARPVASTVQLDLAARALDLRRRRPRQPELAVRARQ